MANQATTTYKVTGTQKAVSNLWNTLQRMEVNSRNIWLDDLAKHYGIDYQKKHISVRGHIYWAEYEEDEDTSLLSFETETAWDACNDLFFEINRLLDDELSISIDAVSVDVRSITPTMKAIIFPKNAASAHPANHSRIVAMMFTALSEKPSGNGLPRPALSRASEPMSRWWTSSMNMSMRTMTPISTSAPSLLNK